MKKTELFSNLKNLKKIFIFLNGNIEVERFNKLLDANISWGEFLKNNSG